MKRVFVADALKYENNIIRVCGWVRSCRSHGKLTFFDLQDKSGILQVVFLDRLSQETLKIVKKVRSEWVVEIIGTINKRPAKTKNPNLNTGAIEMVAQEIKILSEAKTLPFLIDNKGYEISEEIRLKYRYLDLRRERLRKNLKIRQEVFHFLRTYLKNNGFIEVETPILTKSTPEGARDFLVPSRLQKGSFYALPQSPQQYKQLLMVAGVEKYFQIARCFRDEDPRSDRQAEFTQLDIETSFMDEGEILELIEGLMIKTAKEVFPEKKIKEIPFPRISYKKAVKDYKSDKPDLRNNKNNPDELAFAFIVDFPMFEYSKDEKKWNAMHHPFTRPKTEKIEVIKKNPGGIYAHQYDLVLNGYEIGGGSLRIYKPDMLEAVFEVLGHKKENIKKQFGHLLEAFSYGVPPHGGIALGLDRLMAIFMGEPNIREVIAFPKTGDSRDLMMDSPSGVEKNQLEELGLKNAQKRKKK